MRKVFLFMNMSLDGYIEAPNQDLSWAHGDFEAFSAEESRQVDTILLGRRTYEMMRAFWPTPQAAEMIPEIARFMNETCKVVATRQDYEPGWANVAVIHDAVAEVGALKAGPGKDIIMLGSNTLAAALLEAGLLDEVQIVLNPVALGSGTSLFAGLLAWKRLNLKETRPLKNGALMLVYGPA